MVIMVIMVIFIIMLSVIYGYLNMFNNAYSYLCIYGCVRSIMAMTVVVMMTRARVRVKSKE